MLRSLGRLTRLRRGFPKWRRVLFRSHTLNSRRSLSLRAVHARLLHSSGCTNLFRPSLCHSWTVSRARCVSSSAVSDVGVYSDHQPAVVAQIEELKHEFRSDRGFSERLDSKSKPERGELIPRSLWESATAVCIPIESDPSVRMDYELSDGEIGLSGLIRDGAALASLVAEKHAMDDRCSPVNVFILGMDSVRVNSALKSDRDWEMTAVVASVYSARLMVDVHFLPVRREHSIADYLDVLDQGHLVAPLTVSFMVGIGDPFNKNRPLTTNALFCGSDEEMERSVESREQMKRVTASRRAEKTKYDAPPNELESAYIHQLWLKQQIEEKVVLGLSTPKELVNKDEVTGQFGKVINARRLQSTRLVNEMVVNANDTGVQMYLSAMDAAEKCAANLVGKAHSLRLVCTDPCSVQQTPQFKPGSMLKFEALVTATHQRSDVRVYDRLNLFGSKRAVSVLVNVIVLEPDQDGHLEEESRDQCDTARVSHSWIFGLISETEDLPLVLPGSYSEKVLHLEGQKFLSRNFEAMSNEMSVYTDYFNL